MIWPGHPSVLLESGLAEVGEMAAAGRPVDKALIRRLISVSKKAPLAPEPFLVRGVEAQTAGELDLAVQAYLAARQRNPRAVAPRYFLADHYLKAGETGPGLAEISTLARLVPQSLPSVVPYLAAYARTPSAAPQVKKMLDDHPQLEAALLNELAADAANAGLVVDLWSGRGGEQVAPWQSRLLNQLVEVGRYGEARSAWAKFANISAPQDRLFDPEFESKALPPFGWVMMAGSSGIAEPQGAGRLHVIYYGRDDRVLVSQVLTLPPGRYRLSMQVDAGAPASESLGWTVRCLPKADPVASIRLNRSGELAAPFTVGPGGCSAQRLELAGDAPEFPRQAEVTVSQLQIVRDGGR